MPTLHICKARALDRRPGGPAVRRAKTKAVPFPAKNEDPTEFESPRPFNPSRLPGFLRPHAKGEIKPRVGAVEGRVERFIERIEELEPSRPARLPVRQNRRDVPRRIQRILKD